MKKYIMFVVCCMALGAAQRSGAEEGESKTNAVKKAEAAKSEVEWLDNVEEAKAQAAKLDRPILLLYTAPEWCGYCVKLEKEVLETKEFKAYASTNLVLLIADYSDKAEGEKWTAANQALVDANPINGFPHIYLLSPDLTKSEDIVYYEPDWPLKKYTDKLDGAKIKVMAK